VGHLGCASENNACEPSRNSIENGGIWWSYYLIMGRHEKNDCIGSDYGGAVFRSRSTGYSLRSLQYD
jgi:hypothetical protein